MLRVQLPGLHQVKEYVQHQGHQQRELLKPKEFPVLESICIIATYLLPQWF